MLKLVKESLFEDQQEIVRKDKPSNNRMELTAGLVIIQHGSILLVHPKGTSWYGTYSIPKGHIEEGEKILDAAIRETREETGLMIDKKDIIDPEPKYIDYKDKKGNVYKRVYFFIVNPKHPIEKDSISVDNEEVDWAGFVLEKKAYARIFWRLKPVLEEIEKVTKIEKEREKKEKEAEENEE